MTPLPQNAIGRDVPVVVVVVVDDGIGALVVVTNVIVVVVVSGVHRPTPVRRQTRTMRFPHFRRRPGKKWPHSCSARIAQLSRHSRSVAAAASDGSAPRIASATTTNMRPPPMARE